MLRPKIELSPECTPAHASHILLAHHALKPLAAGALYWEAESTLIVADLHLEKGAAYAARGSLLPPYDSRTTLRGLGLVIRSVAPRRVVALGDSFHTSEAAERLGDDDREGLERLQAGREWYWITGNHDPNLPPSIGGIVCAALTICGITLRHEPSAELSSPEIAGHLHPAARIARRGEAIRRKCFATDGSRIVMPAFGAYTGGLNVLDEAFGGLLQRRKLEAWMMGKSGVYPVQARALLPD
jgi:DNA ligase-associated metallophosphoesterase